MSLGSFRAAASVGQLAMAPTDALYKEFGVDTKFLLIIHGANQQPLQILRPISLKIILSQRRRSLITTNARLIFKEMVEALTLELVMQKAGHSSIEYLYWLLSNRGQMEELKQGDYRSWKTYSSVAVLEALLPH